MLVKTIKHAIRAALEAKGYWIRHREALPFGIDFLFDIQRLSDRWAVPIRTFFDVGAHIGETAKAAIRVFPNAQIVAFEPDPDAFSRLQRVQCDRLSAHKIALSDANGTGTFFRYGSAATMNSLIPDSQFAVRSGLPAKTIQVTCQALDDFSETHRIQAIDVLKIDTEGAELSVLRGAKEMLSSGRVRFVYVEFNSMLQKPGTTGGALIPIIEFLSTFGFCFVASYPDNIMGERGTFFTSNALFALPPD